MADAYEVGVLRGAPNRVAWQAEYGLDLADADSGLPTPLNLPIGKFISEADVAADTALLISRRADILRKAAYYDVIRSYGACPAQVEAAELHRRMRVGGNRQLAAIHDEAVAAADAAAPRPKI